MSDSTSVPVAKSSSRAHHGVVSGWARSVIRRRLEGLAGVRLLTTDPWGDWTAGDERAPAVELTVQEPGFYLDVLFGGSLGVARSYIAGGWDSSDLSALLRAFVRQAALTDSLEGGAAWVAGTLDWLRHKLRANTTAGSRRNIREHYDLGNDFFELFLDPTMTYSAAIFETAGMTLEQASIAKLDRICRKLRLGPGDRVLEIGTGWGSFAIHAAGRYGCHVTTTTISSEQHELSAERIRAAGLDDRVDLRLCDYRNLSGRFDKLVSIEMIEAVGHEYLPTYFGKCAALLEDDGAMLLQGITMPENRYAQYLRSTDFIRRYVFPGSCCPSLGAMLRALARSSDLKPVHMEDIGPHYATTLRAWRERFHRNADAIRALGYEERFMRLWDYYLCYCEAGFAERYTGDVQLLLHKPGCRATPPLASIPLPEGDR